MAVKEVTMYRVVCDEDGCEDSTYFAWADPGTPLDEAREAGWYVGEFGELCDDHAPHCPCGAWITDDDDHIDGLCEDCQDEPEAASA